MREDTADTVELPGRVIPIASAAMHMLLAVVMDEHAPHTPQDDAIRALYSSESIFPSMMVPTLSWAWMWSTSLPRNWPGGMYPPVTMMAGISRRAAAIRCPGTMESQVDSMTMPSKKLPSTVSSTWSAMELRLGISIYLGSFSTMPSQMAVVITSRGSPPASRTPCLTRSAREFR